MNRKIVRSSPSSLSHAFLSVLLERHVALLLVPFIYFSGMLLFMGNGGVDVSHAVSLPPRVPASLHVSTGCDSSSCSSPPSLPPPQQENHSHKSLHPWDQLDMLALRDATHGGTTVIVVWARQGNESSSWRDGRV